MSIQEKVEELKEIRDYISKEFNGILTERKLAVLEAIMNSLKIHLPEKFDVRIDKDFGGEMRVFIYHSEHKGVYIAIDIDSNLYFEVYSWPATFIFHFDDIPYDQIDGEIGILAVDAVGAIRRFLDKDRHRH